MPKIQPIAIGPTATVEDLRTAVVKQINTLARTIASSSQRTEPLDLGNNRITSVAPPVIDGDVTTKSYVDRAIATVRDAAHAARSFVGAAFNPPSDGGASLGTTALRWLNVFVKSGLNVGGASAPRYVAEFLSTTIPAVSPVHISDHDADDGGWIMALHGVASYLIHGAVFTAGVGWTAKETSATFIAAVAGGGLQVAHNTGLTVGNVFSPTTIFQVDGSGKLTTYNSSATLANGTMTIPAATTPGSITFVNGVATAFVAPVGN